MTRSTGKSTRSAAFLHLKQSRIYSTYPGAARRFIGGFLVLILAACTGPEEVIAPPQPPTGSEPGAEAGSADPVVVPSVGPTAIPAPRYYIGLGTPLTLAGQAVGLFTERGYEQVNTPDGADLVIGIHPGGEAAISSGWVYALAAPFATIPDNLAFSAFLSYWSSGDLAGVREFGGPPTLVMTQDVADMLTLLYGGPAQDLPLRIVTRDSLEAEVWANRPSLTLLPFDDLVPSLKLMHVDGLSPLDRTLDLSAYPFKVTVQASMVSEAGREGVEALAGLWPAANRDPARISAVVLTGTTALARATAMQIELQGTGFPAAQILPFLADADILHTSNESSFTPNCPPPDWVGDPEFCSDPDYIAVLQGIGLDIAEVTGNHVNDFGPAALDYTLDMYNNRGIAYFGGGRNTEDARLARILTTPDGTRVAFLGCNSVGPFGVYATAETAGAAPCDDWLWIISQIGSLKASNEADLVIVTLQYWELPAYAPSAEQVADFQRLIDAGADIVSGSQAHQPQGFGVEGGGFIHYGVGNLFFDQMDFIENRQMFADKHVLYEGRHISTVLFTGMMEDWAQPRPMTPEERAEFLAIIFQASGW